MSRRGATNPSWEVRRSRARRRSARGSEGLTLIETVLAVTMLALLTAAMFRVFDTVGRASIRQERQLACAELCNRLVLQYLDDPEAMPSSRLPIPYGDDPRGDLYRWEMELEPAAIELASGLRDLREDSPALESLVNRGFQQLTVRVWLSEESGGGYRSFETRVKHEVTRPMDPLAMRNPDTLQSILNSPNGIERFIQMFSGLAPPPPPGGEEEGGAAGAGGAAGRGGGGGR